VLVGNLVRHLGTAKLPAGLSSSSVTPAVLDKLPAAVHHGLSAAYAESIQTVFIIAAPVAAVAFFASWLIPHLELRKAVGTSPSGPTAGGPTEGGTDIPAPPPSSAQREPLVPATHRATPTELA
jgi:hypothetical protein